VRRECRERLAPGRPGLGVGTLVPLRFRGSAQGTYAFRGLPLLQASAGDGAGAKLSFRLNSRRSRLMSTTNLHLRCLAFLDSPRNLRRLATVIRGKA